MNVVQVNADDFGLHADIDRGILECVEAGAVGRLSVVPAGQSVDWSVVRALAAGGVGVGLHLTLCGEPWLTVPWVIPDWRALARRMLLGGGAFRRMLESEVRAQCERFREERVPLNHLDSHQHVHIFPGLWPLCLKMAREFDIPSLRLPVAASRAGRRPTPAGIVLDLLARRRRRAWGDDGGRGRAGLSGIATSPGAPCVGLARSGRNTAGQWLSELDAASAGTAELVAHPGVATLALRARYGFWGYDWNGERAALLSPEFRSGLQARGWAIERKSARAPQGVPAASRGGEWG